MFETTVESRTPSELLFAVPNDMYELLMKTGYISGSSIEIVPVPRNGSYSANPGEKRVSSDYLRNFVLSKSAVVPQNTTTDNQNTPNTNNNDNNQ